jgi:hypothetical protein
LSGKGVTAHQTACRKSKPQKPPTKAAFLQPQIGAKVRAKVLRKYRDFIPATIDTFARESAKVPLRLRKVFPHFSA